MEKVSPYTYLGPVHDVDYDHPAFVTVLVPLPWAPTVLGWLNVWCGFRGGEVYAVRVCDAEVAGWVFSRLDMNIWKERLTATAKTCPLARRCKQVEYDARLAADNKKWRFSASCCLSLTVRRHVTQKTGIAKDFIGWLRALKNSL